MNDNKRIAAYFDFDGTITTRDTLLPFLIFTVGWLKFIINLPRLLPIVLLYYLRIISNEEAKQRTLTLLVAGLKEYLLEHKAKSFALTQLHKYIKPVVYAKLEWHREHGHDLIIVSANLEVYLKYWVKFHKLNHLIGTKLKIDNNGFVTGKLATRNCYGPQKTLRIKEYCRVHNLNYCYSYGYGNSAGDYEMLESVNEAFWINGDYIAQWSGRR